VPRERDVQLGHVDLAAGIGDPGLAVDIRCALQRGYGADRVAPREARWLGTRRRAEHPCWNPPVGGGLLTPLLVGEDHGAGPVRGWTRLEEADRLPHHRRRLYLLD